MKELLEKLFINQDEETTCTHSDLDVDKIKFIKEIRYSYGESGYEIEAIEGDSFSDSFCYTASFDEMVYLIKNNTKFQKLLEELMYHSDGEYWLNLSDNMLKEYNNVNIRVDLTGRILEVMVDWQAYTWICGSMIPDILATPNTTIIQKSIRDFFNIIDVIKEDMGPEAELLLKLS